MQPRGYTAAGGGVTAGSRGALDGGVWAAASDGRLPWGATSYGGIGPDRNCSPRGHQGGVYFIKVWGIQIGASGRL